MFQTYQKEKFFATGFRKEKNIDPSTFPTYIHEYGDGRKIPNVRLYPNELLPDFREHFNNEWLLQKAEQYFLKKDIKAIPYLQKMVLQLPKAQKCEIKEIRSNDDFDKGIDNIIGFEEN